VLAPLSPFSDPLCVGQRLFALVSPDRRRTVTPPPSTSAFYPELCETHYAAMTRFLYAPSSAFT